MSSLTNQQDINEIPENWKLIVTELEIQTAVETVASIINESFVGKDIVVVCILKGAVYFFVDLTRKLTIPHSTYFIEASSYKDSQTQKDVEILSKIIPSKFKGKKVILVDELYDNGHTMARTRDHIANEAGIPVNDIFTVALFMKTKSNVRQDLEIYGLEVPDVWLVGYGLDDKQEKRNLTDLWACPKGQDVPKSPDDVIFESDISYQRVRRQILSQLPSCKQ